MHEGPPKIEVSLEHIPTPEEVRTLFEKFIEGKEYTDRRKLEDEQGLYLWEIELPADADGGHTEYSYVRKGDYKAQGKPGGSSAETVMNVTFFDNDGIPTGGHCMAELVDAEWRIND